MQYSTNVLIKRNLLERKVKLLKRLSVNFLNPWTPKADQDRISPYNINTISSRQVTRKKIISIRRLFTDLKPSSPTQHHKNCFTDSRENY